MKKIIMLCLGMILTACASNHSFVFNDQAVVDQGTGLVWAKNANLPGKPIMWKADDNVYSFIQKLNSDNFAGYADWRVPSKAEFTELIAYAKSLGYDKNKIETWPYQKLRLLGFINVQDYDYWTASRHSPEDLWVADLANGLILPKSEAKPYYLWPVRGGNPKNSHP
jgi:hypothetical protein